MPFRDFIEAEFPKLSRGNRLSNVDLELLQHRQTLVPGMEMAEWLRAKKALEEVTDNGKSAFDIESMFTSVRPGRRKGQTGSRKKRLEP